MESRRGIFVAGMVLGCALGFMSGHVAIWGRATGPEPFLMLDSDSTDHPPIRVAQTPPQLFPTDLSTDFTIPEIGTRPGESTPESQVALRHGEIRPLPARPGLQSTTVPPGEPHPIPVAEATPLADATPPKITDAEAAFEKQLRELIDAELAEHPQSQRDVWYDSLKELSPEHIRGVLQMWKRFGAPDAMPLITIPAHPPVSDPETGDRRGSRNHSSSDLVLPPGQGESGAPVARGLSMARALHLRNLAHVQTPGFKRLIPMPVEHSAEGAPAFADCDARIDFSKGLRHPTDLPLDWAISGPGFFVVQDNDDKLFTRNGHFTLDEQRRICLQEGSRLHPLVPELQLPEQARTMTLQSDGSLSVETVDGEEVAVGIVELAMFVNPAGLEPAGNAFFWETTASGPAQLAAPQQLGTQLLQGHVELSNVQPEEEWQAIETLEDLLDR